VQVSNWFAGTDTHLSNLSAEPNFLIFLIFEIFDFPDSPHCATPQKRSSTRATCTQCDCAGRLEDMVQRVYEMTMPPNSRAEVNIGEELEVVRVDPFFVERQRNQYANRSVAFIVLLNGAAAIVLLAILAKPLPSTEGVKAIADAMIVFSIGAVLGLTSALIAYLNRTLRLDQPGFMTWRGSLRRAKAAAKAPFRDAVDFTQAWNSAIREWLEAKGWGPKDACSKRADRKKVEKRGKDPSSAST
jgi:hypothetical protein